MGNGHGIPQDAKYVPAETWNDWLKTYEVHQDRRDEQLERLSHGLGEVGRSVAALTENVGALVRNQELLFKRTSPQPMNWMPIIATIALVFSFMALLFTPVQRDLERLFIREGQQIEQQRIDAYTMGKRDGTIESLQEEVQALRFKESTP